MSYFIDFVFVIIRVSILINAFQYNVICNELYLHYFDQMYITSQN